MHIDWQNAYVIHLWTKYIFEIYNEHIVGLLI